MQNEDGGWAAFDRTVDRPILEYVPFADNAMQDPGCPDMLICSSASRGWASPTPTRPSARPSST